MRPVDLAVSSGPMAKKKDKKRRQKPVPGSSKVGANAGLVPDKRPERRPRRPQAARYEPGAADGREEAPGALTSSTTASRSQGPRVP